MTVYFLRHADAEGCASSDFDRALTPKGLEQAEKVGKFCVRNGLIPEAILTSPVLRARQTAELVAGRVGHPPLTIESWLACGMSSNDCFENLRAYQELESIVLVGHEPDFGETISAMAGIASADGVHIRKASLTAVFLSEIRAGCGRIEFSVPVRLM